MSSLISYDSLPGFGGKALNHGNDERIKELRSVHPSYAKMYDLWEFYASAYEGGQAFVCEKNIFKHIREEERDYTDRVNRAHNLNYCEPIVDFFTNFIYAKPINRSAGTNKALFDTVAADVNRKGVDVNRFMRDVSDDMQIYGQSHILVDAPVKPQGEVTVAMADSLGLRPYWVLVKPTEILDWVYDVFGRPVYLKRRQISREFVGNGVMVLERFTEFSALEIVTSVIDITDPDKPVILKHRESLPNPVGRVPVVSVKFKPSRKEPDLGVSFLRDFAFNNREIVNLTSMLQEFLYRQAFNVLAKESDGMVPLKDQTDGDVGTSNVVTYPKGGKAPVYIAPASDPASFIQGERTLIKSEMFARAAQGLISELFNGEKSSGFSQAQSFSKTQPYILSRAELLEAAERELWALTMEFAGKRWDGDIKYTDDFSITSLTDGLTHLLMIVKDFQLPSETFVKEELKNVVRKYNAKIPADILGTIDREIEEMDWNKWSSLQEQALVGRTGNSPTEQQGDRTSGTTKEVALEAKQVSATNNLRQ